MNIEMKRIKHGPEQYMLQGSLKMMVISLIKLDVPVISIVLNKKLYYI